MAAASGFTRAGRPSGGVTTNFDIGTFDDADAAYYREGGHRVIAVEASPGLVRAATAWFASQIAAG